MCSSLYVCPSIALDVEPQDITVLVYQYILPLIALFHGRVVDKPEDPMPDTEETSGGEVEHEVCLYMHSSALW